MLSYLEYLKQYLGLPAKIIAPIVVLFAVSQLVGEILSLKGKLVPEFFTFRKYLARKRKEREAIRELPEVIKEFHAFSETLTEFNTLVKEWNNHYSTDNIMKREKWMQAVNHKEKCLEDQSNKLELQSNKLEEQLNMLNEKIDKIGETVLDQSIEDRRNAIINFARIVIDENAPVTREQFNRIFKTYADYEAIIDKNKLTNGEVDISIHIIRESYEEHMRNHTFIEDLRGYN